MSTEGTLSPAPASPAPAPFVDRRKWIHKQLEAVRLLNETLFQHTTVDACWRQQRAALMKQVGLPEIAEYDLKRPTAD